VEDCIEILEDVLNQACLCEDGTLDSMALSAYARGLRFLARRGRVKVISEHGRRMTAEFVEGGD
jgi:hypothetical protein